MGTYLFRVRACVCLCVYLGLSSAAVSQWCPSYTVRVPFGDPVDYYENCVWRPAAIVNWPGESYGHNVTVSGASLSDLSCRSNGSPQVSLTAQHVSQPNNFVHYNCAYTTTVFREDVDDDGNSPCNPAAPSTSPLYDADDYFRLVNLDELRISSEVYVPGHVLDDYFEPADIGLMYDPPRRAAPDGPGGAQTELELNNPLFSVAPGDDRLSRLNAALGLDDPSHGATFQHDPSRQGDIPVALPDDSCVEETAEIPAGMPVPTPGDPNAPAVDDDPIECVAGPCAGEQSTAGDPALPSPSSSGGGGGGDPSSGGGGGGGGGDPSSGGGTPSTTPTTGGGSCVAGEYECDLLARIADGVDPAANYPRTLGTVPDGDDLRDEFAGWASVDPDRSSAVGGFKGGPNAGVRLVDVCWSDDDLEVYPATDDPSSDEFTDAELSDGVSRVVRTKLENAVRSFGAQVVVTMAESGVMDYLCATFDFPESVDTPDELCWTFVIPDAVGPDRRFCIYGEDAPSWSNDAFNLLATIFVLLSSVIAARVLMG